MSCKLYQMSHVCVTGVSQIQIKTFLRRAINRTNRVVLSLEPTAMILEQEVHATVVVSSKAPRRTRSSPKGL